jgi:cobalt-zinc-cadmium efflux system membrane fusion protein
MNSKTNWVERLRASVGRKQLAAIAAVLLLGSVGAVAILASNRSTPASEEDHDHAHGHEEAAEHADDKHREEAGAGVIALSPEQLKAAGIRMDAAGPGLIRSVLQLPGEIRFNEDRTAHVVPRVAGVVEAVPVALGQQVRRGQVLAVISSPAVSEQRAELQAAQARHRLARSTYEREKALWEEKISPQQDVLQAGNALREAEIAVDNARQKLQAVGADAGSGTGNLSRFELRAPFDGTVVEKHIALGEQVKEDAQVFTLSDLRTVWARIDVPASALPQLRVGSQVAIRASAFDQVANGSIAWVGPLLGEQTRTAQARVVVDNPGSLWRPTRSRRWAMGQRRSPWCSCRPPRASSRSRCRPAAATASASRSRRDCNRVRAMPAPAASSSSPRPARRRPPTHTDKADPCSNASSASPSSTDGWCCWPSSAWRRWASSATRSCPSTPCPTSPTCRSSR